MEPNHNVLHHFSSSPMLVPIWYPESKSNLFYCYNATCHSGMVPIPIRNWTPRYCHIWSFPNGHSYNKV